MNDFNKKRHKKSLFGRKNDGVQQISDRYMQKKKSTLRKAAPVFLSIIVIVLVGGLLYAVAGKVKSKIQEVSKVESSNVVNDKKTKKEKSSKKDSSQEETTTEQIPENWMSDKVILKPVDTADTISLKKADLSLFDVENQQQAGQSEDDTAEGPWEQATLTLDSVPGSINQTSDGEPSKTKQLTSTYMVLVDLDSGNVIAERDADKKVSPASMTKILTVLTARDYIDESKLADTYTITDEIVYAAQSSGLSAVGFKPGDTVSVRDMLYGTIVCSGADAAMGLAEYCAGSQEAFVEKMNEKCKLLGIDKTAHFTNVVGKYDKDLYCTMKDMAVILNTAIQDPLLLDVLSKRIYKTEIAYPDLDLPDGIEISNWFLRRIEDKEMNGEVIGAKTGFVNEAGFCCASYYKAKTGKRYICVTGNAYSSWRCIYDHVGVYRSLTE